MRSLRILVLLAAALLGAPAFATTFQVTGWELGETVHVTFLGSARTFATAQFHEVVDGVTGTSFCADLSQYVGVGTHSDFVAYDPTAAESQAFASSPTRRFAWAAGIADRWGNDIGWLSSNLGVTRLQAITGVQTAIWEAVYDGNFAATAASMSTGAWSAYQHVIGASYSGYGNTLLYHSRTRQDQLFTPPVPEPSAVIAFGAGALLVGRALLRRRKRA
ncbi:MAG TPA: PEP-CTERM sorting domain-containing protein [Myxococcota bacterium]|nr:PEP-CTERM sorting domain-containing protein [Myxococcota bacterium]